MRIKHLFFVLIGALVLTVANAAVVQQVITPLSSSVTLVAWAAVANGSTGAPVSISDYADRTVQVTGTFGSGGSVTLQGSNDGTTWATLNNYSGSALTFTSAGVAVVLENPQYIRPSVTAGDGTTSLTITVLGKRTQ